MLTLSKNDFERLVLFIYKNYGIDLSKKQQLIIGRLSSTVIQMGFCSFTEYIDYILETKKNTDIETLINKLTTNYTYFLREEAHFNFFKSTILPYLANKNKNNKVLSIWSAGCSSGEEAYTLSIIIKEFFGNDAKHWDTRILATDISQKAMAKGKMGIYEADAIKALPDLWKRKYFKKVENDDTKIEVTNELKSNVIFKTFNLMDQIRFKINFDVIFCRNVMIYFDVKTKSFLVNKFYNVTNEGGYLLIGHSESINRDETKYKYIMPATYRKV